eukprot:GEMP01055899.1.p1 GENE.GEMP01055899.1~~GEMP01055899.1.p1  ORF type:complete len:368 (+),score=101.23 GEMP01055899.1:213-1316(+)
MFDKLPTPFGLVRSGVAPDHPEVKNVIDDFNAVAASPNFRFCGNVSVGDGKGAVRVAELQSRYDAVVLATGAQFGQRLHLPGSHSGVTDAWSFVQWYNGSMYRSDGFSMPSNASKVAVVGMGNVALDCARILLSSDTERLASSDIVESARRAMVLAHVQRVEVIGRRGAIQSNFGNKELRELLTAPSFSCVVDPRELASSLNAASKEEIAELRAKKRALKIFEDMANAFPGEELSSDADVIIESVGFQYAPLDAARQLKGPLQHSRGKVEDNLYVAGWLKRGPTGTIASNVPDATETAASVCEALNSMTGTSVSDEDPLGALDLLPHLTTFEQWEKLKIIEAERGQRMHKLAEKVTDLNEMLRIMRT